MRPGEVLVTRSVQEDERAYIEHQVGQDLKVITVSNDFSSFEMKRPYLGFGSGSRACQASMSAMVAPNVESMMMRFIALPQSLALPTRVLATTVAQFGGRCITQMTYFCLIHRSAWKKCSANFACKKFSEVH